MSGVELIHGDCLAVMRDLPDASVDAVVTDPPYGLGFMGREWDALPPGREWAEECLRVLTPGGHLLAFGGTRTWHRLACAVEDAGFEVRDSIAWLYGSGFPKSLDVSKAIERNKTTGNHSIVVKGCAWIADLLDREGINKRALDDLAGTSDMGGWWASRLPHRCALPTAEQWERLWPVLGDPPEWLASFILPANAHGEAWARRPVTQAEARPLISGKTISFDQRSSTERERRDIPATDDARTWQGWGTALKPAFEPIVVARKPLVGTVAANVLAHGTGALNIDGCRIDYSSEADREQTRVPNKTFDGSNNNRHGSIRGTGVFAPAAAGRWPANVVLDEDQAAALDEQSGALHTQDPRTRRGTSEVKGVTEFSAGNAPCYDDDPTTGASRFFYTAKADSGERVKVDGIAHPTVKPLSLMRWLVRLVTPPGGTILEPFAGSGTTVEACILEGFNCIAIEREADYLPLIQQRINRRRDPVAAIKATGDDGGLFDLLDGGAA